MMRVGRNRRDRRPILPLAALAILLGVLAVIVFRESAALRTAEESETAGWEEESSPWALPTPALTPEPAPVPTPTSAPTPEPVNTPEPTPTPLPAFEPVHRESDQITGTRVSVDGETVTAWQADAAHTIDFGVGDEYTELRGIVTFRGNNFRDTAQYGLAEITDRAFGDHWVRSSSGQADNEGEYWSGSGWTGQPLVVEWPASTRQIMDMYDWAKEKDGLVEVIYATLGGTVYFLDLETGERTRDPLYLGFSFKGAGALDPRGYPLLYVGGGLIKYTGEVPRIMVVSLIDGQVLYTIGNSDSFAPRGWSAFDSSALVDAETDTLIYPGENGVLYLIRLHSRYDEEAGTISVDPEPIRFVYESATADQYYYGMEDSAIAWRGHLLIADNGADFVCIDLNTLEIEWCFNCLDDTNCTGVLELDEDGHPYVYLSTSFHLGWRSYDTAEIPVWKIDAVTGEEVWRREYTCYSADGSSGGSQASLALGKGPLEGIVYAALSRTPGGRSGTLLALDTETGEELWTYTSDRSAWSSPVCVYDTEGRGYVLYTAINGIMDLFDGLTGEVYDTFSFGAMVEASPVVYNNTIVVGTKSEQIYGIALR